MYRKAELSNENYDLLQEIIQELSTQGRLQEERNALQHGATSVYEHSVNVAYRSLLLTENFRLPVDKKVLVRGALLHDYFLYDWHAKNEGHRMHGFRHPGFALRNASRDYSLCWKERNIIARHMFPLTVLPPQCLEAWIVCFVDKYCAFSETMGDSLVLGE